MPELLRISSNRPNDVPHNAVHEGDYGLARTFVLCRKGHVKFKKITKQQSVPTVQAGRGSTFDCISEVLRGKELHQRRCRWRPGARSKNSDSMGGNAALKSAVDEAST